MKAFLSYEDTGSLKYWLLTVLRHQFLNLQRKRKKEILDNGEEILKYYSVQGKSTLENMIHQEERKQLFLAIQELSFPMKEILMETVYFKMKDSEIAKMHGLTMENVRKIRSRAKQKLIEKLKEEKS